MPPFACSKRPMRWRSAPVNAPRSCPKSSDSSSVSGSAAQFTFTSGPSRARRRAVDQARDQLLAGARLAGDEHRRARRRHAQREVDGRAQRRAVADDLVDGAPGGLLLAQLAHLGEQPAVLERARDAQLDLLEVDRLLHEVEGPDAHRLDGGLDRAVGGHQQHARAGIALARGAQHGQTIGARQPQIGEHDVEGLAAGSWMRASASSPLAASSTSLQLSRSASATPPRSVSLSSTTRMRASRRALTTRPRPTRAAARGRSRPRRARSRARARRRGWPRPSAPARGRRPSRAPWW